MLGDILFFRILKEVSEDKPEKIWGEKTALADTSGLRITRGALLAIANHKGGPDGKKEELPYRSRQSKNAA